MPECKTAHGLSESQFSLILDQLLDDQEFREAFFADPRDALGRFGITLTGEEMARLRNLKGAESHDSMADFNEKLVLCSSSGY